MALGQGAFYMFASLGPTRLMLNTLPQLLDPQLKQRQMARVALGHNQKETISQAGVTALCSIQNHRNPFNIYFQMWGADT